MRLLAFIGFLAIVVVIGGAVFFFGGFFNVSGLNPDQPIVGWGLQNIRESSIDRHATDSAPFPLDDPAIVQAGARAFSASGCANCHGAPGVKWAKFSEGLRPDPPDLGDVAKELSAAKIFWVVKNGINMTGMPSFGRIGADDKEIWSIAAFVKKLPSVSESDYRSWTASPVPAAAAAPLIGHP